ncbi:MAG: hypothetical protein ACK55Z_02570, partial [bacterium]
IGPQLRAAGHRWRATRPAPRLQRAAPHRRLRSWSAASGRRNPGTACPRANPSAAVSDYRSPRATA